MGFEINEISANSNGGTELMQRGLIERIGLENELLDQFQIISSRVRELHEDKIRVLWLHDLPGDPESEHLKDGGHERFHVLVFVSNWQMQQYTSYYSIPWHKCVVIENAIDPIMDGNNVVQKEISDTIKLIYHTTPHRGLEILVPVFKALCEKHDNIELDVFSSFKIYGWEHRDQPYQQIIDDCKQHPKINYHGTVPNSEVREALKKAHIFAYPSIWTETSCISLIEAMSAGCICVHPNLGALYETAGGTTMMYQYQDTPQQHAETFFGMLDVAITEIQQSKQAAIGAASLSCSYANLRFTWPTAVAKWRMMLKTLHNRYQETESRKLPVPVFHYKIS